MSNSALPIVSAAVLIAVVLAIGRMHPADEPGTNGPEITPGIFRLPAATRLRLVSAPLRPAITIKAVSPEGPDAAAPERWRVVMLTADDDGALTRAAVLGCAERLTELGSVVLIGSPRSQPLALPADRLMRFATVTASLPRQAGGACSASLTVDDRLLAFPLDHPAASAQPAVAAPLDASLTITLVSAALEPKPTWASWYAALGRAMAGELFTTIVPHGMSKGFATVPGNPARAYWKSRLPDPPQIQPVHWRGAMQEEFVRGWIGEIIGLTMPDEQGGSSASIASLEKLFSSSLLRGDKAWQRVRKDDQEELWQREEDAASLSARKRPWGWELILWQQREGIATTFQAWLKAAAAGDRQAARQLERYRDCAAVPSDLRARIPQNAPAGTAPVR